ncbi:GNAT family N-acetyltransferase [Paeniglutamicibacter antarcticus]|uniref:GNAT family N-acetyltransferase n=2 Tax=Paeniglutamicibacter antarcticus TaxID=494023 RepID=A0ABP9THE1_9MICC
MIRLERFKPELLNGTVPSKIDEFLRAVSRGFHESVLDAQDLVLLARLGINDNSTFTAIYDDSAVVPSLHARAPVATYAGFGGTLNIGAGTLVPVHQITSVTVSPTHRRRGLLRLMITQDLAIARRSGFAFAALTASEATIYGRFGFGRATQRVRFSLKTEPAPAMRVETEGRIVAIEPSELKSLAPGIHAAAHQRTTGSIAVSEFEVGQAAGHWEDFDSLKPPSNLRAALHLDPEGTPDGFMSYTFSGWKASPPTMEIGQLCAASGAARRELIAYLGTHDLIEKVTGRGPLDDAFPSALQDARAYTIEAMGDHLWLRILDVPSALAARGYRCDGRIRLCVRDELGLAEGTWDLVVAHGVGTTSPAPSDAVPDASIHVRDLASLYLGGFSAAHLAEAGVLRIHAPDALARIEAMFATTVIPYCQAEF